MPPFIRKRDKDQILGFSPSATRYTGPASTGHEKTARKGAFMANGFGQKGTAKRHRKILRDNIAGITKNDIRRLARRGGVKRIQRDVFEGTRLALKSYLTKILKTVIHVIDYMGRKTVTTSDVVFALKKNGTTIYGFGDVDLAPPPKKTKATKKKKKGGE